MPDTFCDVKTLEKYTVISCPFDESHVMYQSSYLRHVIKCKDRHPDTKKVACPFNAYTYLLPEDMEEHIQTYHENEQRERNSYKKPEYVKNEKCEPQLFLNKPSYVDDITYTKLLHLNYNYEGFLGMCSLRDKNL